MNNSKQLASKYAGHLGAIGQNGGKTSRQLPSRRDTRVFRSAGKNSRRSTARQKEGEASKAGLVHVYQRCCVERGRCLLKVFASSDLCAEVESERTIARQTAAPIASRFSIHAVRERARSYIHTQPRRAGTCKSTRIARGTRTNRRNRRNL